MRLILAGIRKRCRFGTDVQCVHIAVWHGLHKSKLFPARNLSCDPSLDFPKGSRMKRAATVILGFLTLAGAAAVTTSLAQPAGVVTGDKLRVPDNYRMTSESLGAWAVAADTGGGSKE